MIDEPTIFPELDAVPASSPGTPPPAAVPPPAAASSPGTPPPAAAPPPPAAVPPPPADSRPIRRREPGERLDPSPRGGAGPRDDAGERAPDARLARLHLRGGLLALARAELEQMAGIGALDREALVDLAEARWRSGDLEGGAEAAAAHVAAGGEEPLAHLIVAEQADREGRLVDARRHAAVVRERLGAGLDRLFAGEPRSTAWPLEAPGWMDGRASLAGRWGLLVGGAEVAAPDARTWVMAPPPVTAGTGSAATVTGSVPTATASFPALTPQPGSLTPAASVARQLAAGRAAGHQLEMAEAELARGEVGAAADRLAVVLRLDPGLAPVILSIVERAAAAATAGVLVDVPALHLLRGDAYRGMGREVEAAEAYQHAVRALGARPTDKEPS